MRHRDKLKKPNALRPTLICLLLIASSTLARSDILVTDAWGCLNVEDNRRLVKLNEVDPEGAHALLKALLASARCRLFKMDERVATEKWDSHRVCVIPRDETECYWMSNTKLIQGTN